MVDLLPGAVAAAVAVVLVGLTYREVYWRGLRLLPVTLATLIVLAASPLLFSLTVTFPYHSYRLLWDRFSVESLSSRAPAGGLADFDRRRAEAAARFADFGGRYPASSLAPEALIQEARLLNLRAVAAADGRLQSFEDRIAPEALPIYASITKLAPASVAAARARLEQAAWSLQNGRFEEAGERYRDVLVTYETHISADYEPPADLLLRGVCRRVGHPPGGRTTAGRPGTTSPSTESAGTGLPFSPEETQVAYYEAYLTARQALAFLGGNGQVEGEPLRLFLRLSPSSADYGQRLEELLLLYPEDVYPDLGLLADVRVALVRGLPDEEQRLTQLLGQLRRREGRGRALYRLAELARARGDSPGAERYLRQLVEETLRDKADRPPDCRLELVWAAALVRQGLVDPPWPQPFP
jgi:tetratricopeptide (TPR) repeat protein